MRIIVLGAPGSGKGTQADYLTKMLQIPKISTGDMLRAAIAAGNELGRQVESIMATGELIADELILKLVQERIEQNDCRQGFLFDGFPRTIVQAQSLWQANIDVDYIIEIQVADADIISRLTGRWIHSVSGRVYHVKFNPPKKSGYDDLTGEPLIQRDDDQEDVVRQRLFIYHKQTEPLTHWYKSKDYTGKAVYVQISGAASVDVVRQNILKSLNINA